jgi:hypothetical protein
MHAVRRLHAAVILAVLLFLLSRPAAAQQQSQPAALEALRAAVASELQASETDKSIWMYRDRDDSPEKRATYETIETRQGSLRKLIELNGRPLTPAEAAAEDARIGKFLRDAAEQSKAHKNSTHDDAQATELLKILPDAFIWTISSQTPECLNLSFRPNPAFRPPDIEARIMGMMAGEMVIAHEGNRIRTFKGQLTDNVNIGFGLVRMYKGGTFDIERRQVGGGTHWQITETHVHIAGHALFFKTIGTQEDEVKTEWKPSPAETIEAAARALGVER